MVGRRESSLKPSAADACRVPQRRVQNSRPIREIVVGNADLLDGRDERGCHRVRALLRQPRTSVGRIQPDALRDHLGVARSSGQRAGLVRHARLRQWRRSPRSA